MQIGQLNNAADALAFILAGNATITLRSEKTSTRYTYKIKASKDGNLHFVSLMNGSDNEGSFQYMGLIRNGDYQHGRKSHITVDASCNKAFAWMFALLREGRIHDQLKIWHEGRCGRCGRKLTVPESIEQGLGPECVQHRVDVSKFLCQAA